MKRLYVGSDHAGFDFKQTLLKYLKDNFESLEVIDCGSHDTQSIDYPTIAKVVAEKVSENHDSSGILICGTGIGMCIAANKVKGIRAATVWDEETAKLSKEHNNANVLCLGARVLKIEQAQQIVKLWLNTSFLAGRHANRVDLITNLERKK